VPEQGQPPTRAQQLRRLGVPATGSTQCQDCPAVTASMIFRPDPGLERRHLDLKLARSREVGHPGIDCDTEHRATSRLELSSSDSGAGADVEQLRSAVTHDDRLYQRIGIAGRLRS
jgi:hypothetical protein